MTLRDVDHVQVIRGTLVTGEPDEANFPGFLRLEHGLKRATLGEDAIGVVRPDVLVELQEVDAIR